MNFCSLFQSFLSSDVCLEVDDPDRVEWERLQNSVICVEADEAEWERLSEQYDRENARDGNLLGCIVAPSNSASSSDAIAQGNHAQGVLLNN